MATETKPLRVLVSGAGVAGPCFAWWLSKALEPKPAITIIERAPEPRSAGQAIDLRNTSVEIVEKMGLTDAVKAKTTTEEGIAFINAKNKVIAEFKQTGDNKGFTSSFEILRADLADLFVQETRKLGNINYVYGQRIQSITQDSGVATVGFTGDLESQQFDLLVGADGALSSTRSIILGPDTPEKFKFLGAYFAFYTIPYDASKDEPPMWRWYNAFGGRHLSTRPHNNHKTSSALLGHVTPTVNPDPEWEKALEAGPEAQKKLFRTKFADAGWEATRLLDAMDSTHDFYLTPVKQLKLPSWSKGCCALAGDAAWNPTFLSGNGTALAIEGAYILAGEIGKLGGKDIPKALSNYETVFRPYTESVQKQASRAMISSANPQTKWFLAIQRGFLSFAYHTRVYKLLAEKAANSGDDKRKAPDYKWLSL